MIKSIRPKGLSSCPEQAPLAHYGKFKYRQMNKLMLMFKCLQRYYSNNNNNNNNKLLSRKGKNKKPHRYWKVADIMSYRKGQDSLLEVSQSGHLWFCPAEGFFLTVVLQTCVEQNLLLLSHIVFALYFLQARIAEPKILVGFVIDYFQPGTWYTQQSQKQKLLVLHSFFPQSAPCCKTRANDLLGHNP